MSKCFNVDELINPKEKSQEYSEDFVKQLEGDLANADDATKVGAYQESLNNNMNQHLPSTVVNEDENLKQDFLEETQAAQEATEAADQAIEEASAELPFGEAIGFAVGAIDIYTRSQTNTLTAAAVAADVTGLLPFVGPLAQAGFGTWDLLQRHDKNVEDYIALWVPAYAIVKTWNSVWTDLNPDGKFVNDAKSLFDTAKNLPTQILKNVISERKKAYEKGAQLFISHASDMQEDRLNRSLTLSPAKILDRLLSMSFSNFRRTFDISPSAKTLALANSFVKSYDKLKDKNDSKMLSDLVLISGAFSDLFSPLVDISFESLLEELKSISDEILNKTLAFIDESVSYPKNATKIVDHVQPGQFSLKKDYKPSDDIFYHFFTQREGVLVYYLADLWQSYTKGAPEKDLLAQLKRTTKAQAPLLGKEFVNEMKIMKTGVLTQIARLVAQEDEEFAKELFSEAKELKNQDLKGIASQAIASMITPGGLYSFIAKNENNIKDIKDIIGIAKKIEGLGNIPKIKKQLDPIYDDMIKLAKKDIIEYKYDSNPAPNVLNHIKVDKSAAIRHARSFFQLFNKALPNLESYLENKSIDSQIDLSSHIESAVVSRIPVIAPTVPEKDLDWSDVNDLSSSQLLQPVYIYDMYVKDGSIDSRV